MLEKLLNEDLITFYWVGYLLADGSISEKRLEISSINEKHLKKLSYYLNKDYKSRIQKYGYNVGGNIYTLLIGGRQTLLKIKEKFDIHNNKTLNPPNFIKYKFTNDQLIAMFIGFIDGDGTIAKKCGQNSKRKDFFFRIQIHSSWLDFLKNYCVFFSDLLNLDIPEPKINTRGYALLQNSNTIWLKYLKRFSLDNNLPIMDYKWIMVDLNFISKSENIIINKENIESDIKNGLCNNKIRKKYKTSYSIINKIRSEIS